MLYITDQEGVQLQKPKQLMWDLVLFTPTLQCTLFFPEAACPPPLSFLASPHLLLASPKGQDWDAAGGKEKEEMILWLLPHKQKCKLCRLLLSGRPAPSQPVCPLQPSGRCTSPAHAVQLQQALCHFPFKKQARGKGSASSLQPGSHLQPASPWTNVCE